MGAARAALVKIWAAKRVLHVKWHLSARSAVLTVSDLVLRSVGRVRNCTVGQALATPPPGRAGVVGHVPYVLAYLVEWYRRGALAEAPCQGEDLAGGRSAERRRVTTAL